MSSITSYHLQANYCVQLAHIIVFSFLYDILWKGKEIILFSFDYIEDVEPSFLHVYARSSTVWYRASGIFTHFERGGNWCNESRNIYRPIYVGRYARRPKFRGWKIKEVTFLFPMFRTLYIGILARTNYDSYSPAIPETEMRNRRYDHTRVYLLILLYFSM